MVSSGISARGSHANRSFCGTIFEDDTSPRRPCSSRTKLCKITDCSDMQWLQSLKCSICRLNAVITHSGGVFPQRFMASDASDRLRMWHLNTIQSQAARNTSSFHRRSDTLVYFGAVCQFLNWLKLFNIFNGWCMVVHCAITPCTWLTSRALPQEVSKRSLPCLGGGLDTDRESLLVPG